MSAYYIIRLDDASEYMNYSKWISYFELFDKYKINPIIAVIPFNKDPKMINNNPDADFWNKVRDWQSKGYRVAMHGYEHVYTSNSGGIIGMNKRSEFAGVSLEEQVGMLSRSYQKFADEKIMPEIFVSPAHSFDKNTLKALKRVTNIKYISDGYYLNVIRKNEFIWIPQQLWEPKEKLKGVWTICIHPETSNLKDFEKVNSFIQQHSNDFADPLSLKACAISTADRLYWFQRRFKLKLRDLVVKYFKEKSKYYGNY